MNQNSKKFLTKHVDIFEDILKTLWKTPIEIVQTSTITQEKNKWIMKFICSPQKIQLEMVIETKQKKIKRISMVYKQYTNDINVVEQYLALSFLYECPADLELCNQYGLYKKEDIKQLDQENKKIRQQRNLLNNNQFYIFNMNRINDHCADLKLDQLLQQIHHLIYDWESSSK